MRLFKRGIKDLMWSGASYPTRGVYQPSEQEFLLRKRGSVITPAYGTVYLWVDSVKQHCQLLIDDNHLSSLQISSKEERMSATRISLNPIEPGNLLRASLPYTDTYPILGSSNGSNLMTGPDFNTASLQMTQDHESTSKRICLDKDILRSSESYHFGWDSTIFSGTNPIVPVASHTNSRGVSTADVHVPLARDDGLFWHNSEETLNFFTANASDTQNEASTDMLGPTDALQELVDIDEELKGPTNRSQSSLLSQIITSSEGTIVTEDCLNGYRCPVPSCTWSQVNDTSSSSLDKIRKKFKSHFHTHSKEARLQSLKHIPLPLIGENYVCNECAQLFRINNDGTVRSHGCALVTLPLKLVRSSSESGVNTPSPPRPLPSGYHPHACNTLSTHQA